MSATRFQLDGAYTCKCCRREVDAVQRVGRDATDQRLVSRHLADEDSPAGRDARRRPPPGQIIYPALRGFCRGSLEPIARLP